MKFSRRGILKSLPAIPFAARSAASAVTAEIEQATGATVGLGKLARSYRDEYDISDRLSEREEKQFKRLRAIFDYVKVHGIPEFKRKEIRVNARMNRVLDPDIAALRSVSVSAKLQMQWKRTEARYIEKELNELNERKTASDWLKRWDVDYW